MTTKDKLVPTTQNSQFSAHLVRGKCRYYRSHASPEQGENVADVGRPECRSICLNVVDCGLYDQHIQPGQLWPPMDMLRGGSRLALQRAGSSEMICPDQHECHLENIGRSLGNFALLCSVSCCSKCAAKWSANVAGHFRHLNPSRLLGRRRCQRAGEVAAI